MAMRQSPATDLAVLGQDERVDLGDPAIVVLEGLVEAHDGLADGREDLGRHLELDGEIERIVEAKAAKDIHVHLGNLLLRHCLDIHARLRC